MEYKKILIIGRPNVGKTSFVNCLAGSKLKVGNFAGVTTQMQSVATSIDNKIVELIDSPGLYSINSPSGRDEEEVVKFLEQVDKFDFILNVVDATKIQSELILTQEILNLKLNKPMAICLNSYDIALKNGLEIDIEKLKQLLQIPIIRLNSCNSFSCCNQSDVLNDIFTSQNTGKEINNIFSIFEKCSKVSKPKKTIDRTSIIDKILLHRIIGLPIFFFVMFAVFKATFSISDYAKQFLEMIFNHLTALISAVIPNYEIANILNNGVLQGCFGVLQFMPSIVLLFIFINILETTGYMVRISFLMDSIMKFFGLSGKAVIPFISGFGCSIPAYMSARILPSKIQRLGAMFAIGFMTCSAKFTFFVMLISAMFSAEIAPYIMLGIYLTTTILGLVVAGIIGKIMKMKDQKSLPFVIEMPKYKVPSIKNIARIAKKESIGFIKKAGTTIAFFSFVIFVLSNYPKSADYNAKFEAAQSSNNTNEIKSLEKDRLSNSVLAKVSHGLDFAFAPLGFTWRENSVILSGLVGKEVGISTINILYDTNIGEEDGDEARSQAIMPIASCIALIVFFMLYLPCLSATITFKKESEYKFATLALVLSTTAIAYIFAFLAYRVSLYLLF